MLAFGLGLVFGFCFDTMPARRPARRRRSSRRPSGPIESDADRPIAREREEETVVRS